MSRRCVSSSSLMPADGSSAFRSFIISSRNRSTEIPAAFFWISALKSSEYVSFSILNLSWAANLIARIGRSPSSIKRSDGFPTVLIIPCRMSFCPPNGSTTVPSARFTAIAFIVKSRRLKSSCIVAAYSMWSGCRPSEYPDSVRNVVTSISFFIK